MNANVMELRASSATNGIDPVAVTPGGNEAK
jgi:hypothetical protein